MGGEYFLTAVGGCFMSTLLAAIKAREAPVTNVRTDVKGVLAEDPTRFSSVSLLVRAECEDGDLLNRLVQIAENGCSMVTTLKRDIEFSVSAEA